MLTRLLSALLVLFIAAGVSIGQDTDNKSKSELKGKKMDKIGGVEALDQADLSKPHDAAGPISVLSPNGEEVWDEATIQTITWDVQAKVEVDSVAIRLVEEPGAKTVMPRVVELAVVKGNPGTWTWEGVTPSMTHCRIEVEAFSKEKILLKDVSDAPFTILENIRIDDPVKTKDGKVHNPDTPVKD